MDKKKVIVSAALGLSKLYLDVVNDYESTSSDDENLQQLLEVKLKARIKPRQRKIPRCDGYYERIIPQYLPGEFQQHFRLTSTAFEALCGLLVPLLKEEYTTGRLLEKPEKKILATLWLLATPDSYRSVGTQFDMGKSSLSDSFILVVKALQQLAARVINWPREENRRRRIIAAFYAFAKLNNVIGAVDGTFIPIKAPKENPHVYITRKCFFAVILQAIAEPSLKFIDCFTGYPGSVSDARIFRNSYIFQQIQQHPGQYCENTFIIGDKAYPLLNWCIPPYIERQQLTPIQRHFNKAHAKTRQMVERSFALLFGRFRRLQYLNMNRLDLIPATILACCILHNLCLNHEDLLVEAYIQEGLPFVREHLYHDPEYIPDPHPNEPRNMRDNIARQLFERRNRRRM